MASQIYNSAIEDLVRGAIDFDTDTFMAMLVLDTYTPDVDAHAKRSDVTNEVANGNGYTTGGTVVAVTITRDNANNRIDVAFADHNYPSASFTARAAVIYKSRGGAANLDELVAYVDFLANITATNGTFSVDFTSPLRFQM